MLQKSKIDSIFLMMVIAAFQEGKRSWAPVNSKVNTGTKREAGNELWMVLVYFSEHEDHVIKRT